MRMHTSVAAAALSLASAGAPSWAQTPVFASRTELVVLSATAVDEKGRPVTNLKRQEFTVFEDGRPQPIAHFSEGPAVAARVLILVDASGSMNAELKVTSARMAVTQFLSALAPQDSVALAGFDSEYWGIVGWTTDHNKVEEGFNRLKPFGSTALHDALDHAARDLASHGEGRRAVVVITDGVDTASQATADDVIARSRALDVPIYAVSVVAPIDDPRAEAFTGKDRTTIVGAGRALLDRYAAQSGGAAFVVSDFAGLKKAADLIALEFRHQYRLGYDPPEGPTRFRRVEVRTTRKGVLVRTRSGYIPS
jgi:Ca-activated chloride channel family protein